MKTKLYTKPIVTGWVFTLLGFLLTFNPILINFIIPDYKAEDANFALAALGVLFIITGITVLAMYQKLNRDFQKMLGGNPFFSYIIPPDLHRVFAEESAKDLKAMNKGLLIVMLVMTVVVAFILTVVFEDALILVICTGLAVFLTVCYFVITTYRVKKIKRSQAFVCLAIDGAYCFGQIYSWGLPGTWLNSIEYIASQSPYVAFSCGVASFAGPQTFSGTIPIMSGYENDAFVAVNAINAKYKGFSG